MMKALCFRLPLLAWFIGGGLAFTSVAASAQTTGRVLRDQSIIWRIDSAVPAASVPAGTTLEILAVRDDGYCEVFIPEQFGGRGERGRISCFVLDLPPGQDVARGAQPSAQPASDQPSGNEPAAAFRGFGSIGVAQFAARQSFEAVFGEARGMMLGAGAQVRFRNGMFVQGSIDRLSKTGERVVVLDGTIFPLGIENKVTITPLHVTAGYRMRASRSIAPYGGGGISFVNLTQTTEFDLPEEQFTNRSRGWNAIGGVEYRVDRSVSIAAELRYEQFATALGSGGVSQLFNEHNLGGLRTQFKVIVGR
jgi:opacity protein-like surface antigen